MRIEPGAYGRLGLSDLFEMREECLREFGFSDVYRWRAATKKGFLDDITNPLISVSDEPATVPYATPLCKSHQRIES